MVKRAIKHAYQKLTRGFSDRETWGLYYEIAKFTLPRLKRFKEVTICYPIDPRTPDPESWEKILDTMIFAFEWIILDETADAEDTPEARALVKQGFQYFGEFFQDLWW